MDRGAIWKVYDLDSDFPERWTETSGAVPLDSIEDDVEDPNDSSRAALLEQFMASIESNGGRHDSLVDEVDPLGGGQSILDALRSHGINVNDPAERAKYLLSSTKFNPRLFLTVLHGDESRESLRRGLKHLHLSRESDETGLRNLVDDDYEKYVSSKRRLDEVMARAAEDHINESTKFGTSDLQGLLEELSARMTLSIRPLESYSQQRTHYQAALQTIQEQRSLLGLPSTLKKLIKQREHDKFVREFKRGTDHLLNFKSTRLERLVSAQLEACLDEYRSQLWKKLMDTPADEAYAPYLRRLVDLGVQQNPAVDWMNHQISIFQTQLEELFDQLTLRSNLLAMEAMDSDRKLSLAPFLIKYTDTRCSQLSKNDDVDWDVRDPLADLVVDNSDVIEGWVVLVELFGDLQNIMSRASIFYRECAALQHGRKDVRLRFTDQQDKEITGKCLALVETVAGRLRESLTVPTPKHMALPIASMHQRDTSLEEPTLSFLPLNTNVLASAKYLTKLLDILSVINAELSDLLGPQNAFSGALEVANEQFVKTLCECWTRDSQVFGDLQNWDGTLPQVFENFHLLVLERLKLFKDPARGSGNTQAATSKRVASIFPAAISLCLKSINNYLVESEKSVPRSEFWPKPIGQDKKVLVTLNDLDKIRVSVLPQLYEKFEALVHQDSDTTNGVVEPVLDHLSTSLFGLFGQKKKAQLSRIVSEQVIAQADKWARSKSNPTMISGYVYESLFVLVNIHSMFLELCPQRIREVLHTLYHHFLTCLLSSLRELDTLGTFGTLQTVADLEFVRSASAHLGMPETHRVCQLIFDQIKSLSSDKSVWSGQEGPRAHVRTIIEGALRKEQFTFLCFKTI